MQTLNSTMQAIRTRYVEDYMAECNYYRLLSYVNERQRLRNSVRMVDKDCL